MMDWYKLLCDERLQRPNAKRSEDRSLFQQDLDRIVFSSAFRRLAHKTQVHPLAENDHVHTRLTHSIEVACVGRSLGTIVGTHVAPGIKGSKKISADTFGDVVQAACLAHDIGNPPFGHSGEAAISKWFVRYFKKKKHKEEVESRLRNDLLNFEGNAQGFRILTQLENNKWDGGLQLTKAVLATFSKYPHSAKVHPISDSQYIGCKKIGFFESEEIYFKDICKSVGLIPKENYWCRHPLAFLVEAADDICYAIIDIEDGYDLKYLDFSTAKKVLTPIAGDDVRIDNALSSREKVAKWRAVAIGNLIGAVAKAFMKNKSALLNGTFGDELLAHTPYKGAIIEAKKVAKEEIFWSERKTQIEIASEEILSGLLDLFVPVTEQLASVKWNSDELSGREEKLARLCTPYGFEGVTTHYGALLRVTDFVSGMTDRYALDLYRKLKGISI